MRYFKFPFSWQHTDFYINKQKFIQFLAENPYIARKKGINTYTRTTGCLN